MATCAYCGTDVEPLDDADHCAVCRLYHLTAVQMGVCRDLKRIGDAVREAVIDGWAHPDDVRVRVEAVLRSPDLADGTSVRQREHDVALAVNLQLDLLRVQLA